MAAAAVGMAAAAATVQPAPAAPKRTQLSSRSWVDVGKVPPELAPVPGSEGFEALWALRPPQRGTVKMWGKDQTVPRWQQAWGAAYSFSGQTLFAGEPVPPALQPYLDWANQRSGYGSGRHQGILLNWYENGQDYIGPHSDDERDLVPGEPIISLSLGQTRTFRVTCRKDCKRPAAVASKDWSLGHGGMLVMGGDMQKQYKHEVTKTANKMAQGRRINITLRAFRGAPTAGAGAAAAAEPNPPAAEQRAAKRQRT